jgi:hypothetical protein
MALVLGDLSMDSLVTAVDIGPLVLFLLAMCSDDGLREEGIALVSFLVLAAITL